MKALATRDFDIAIAGRARAAVAASTYPLGRAATTAHA